MPPRSEFNDPSMPSTSAPTIEPNVGGDDEIGDAWDLLRAAARWARGRSGRAGADLELALDSAGALTAAAPLGERISLHWRNRHGWVPARNVPPAAHALLDLYLPVCGAAVDATVTVGHLGQSLDGHIATGSGDSYYVTGAANVLHLHRMRALCDAVLVGAETVAVDDPQLTARRAAGDQPARIVLDPRRRLSAGYRVLSDGQAATLLICDEATVTRGAERIGNAEVLGIPCRAGRLDLEALLGRLHARGLYSVFVEGGGKTVSRFLEAGLLDRLHIAIAPLVTGAGRRGLDLPERFQIRDCLRPAHRIFRMGGDVLFDCDLRSAPVSLSVEDPSAAPLSRVL